LLQSKGITKLLILLTISLILPVIYIRYPLEHNEINGVFNSLISASGVLIGLLITYIITKIFQIRAVKKDKALEIKALSMKVTNFRSLIKIILRKNKFWREHKEILSFVEHFPRTTYFDFAKSNGKKAFKSLDSFIEKNNYSYTRIALFLTFKEFVNNANDYNLLHGLKAEVDYSIEDLVKFYDAIQWQKFMLDDNFGESKGELVKLFDFECLNNTFNKNIIYNYTKQLLRDDCTMNIETFRRIVETMDSVLFDLLKLNNNLPKLPRSLKSFINTILLISVFGIIIPNLFMLGDFDYWQDIVAIYVSFGIVTCCFLWSLVDISMLINFELNIE
jgi:hypothetical protein